MSKIIVTKNQLVASKFQKLVTAISELYQNARKAQVMFAWETGRRIVEVEQDGAVKAEYGERLLAELSKALTQECGPGFSPTNLYDMRRFYLTNKILRAPVKLTWANYNVLQRIKDLKVRKAIEKRVEEQGLTNREVRRLVSKVNSDGNKKPIDITPLKRPADLKLNTFRKSPLKNVKLPGSLGTKEKTLKNQKGCGGKFPPLCRGNSPAALRRDAIGAEPLLGSEPEARSAEGNDQGGTLIDCGFFVNWVVRKEDLADLKLTDTPSYTYAATIERVVDGDTLLVLIDVGFGIIVRDKLRLRGIDTPELGTPEGDKAKRYVEKLLPPDSTIILKSYKFGTDKYGRFVVDIFYKNGTEQPQEIIDHGTYLNQELLDQGLAINAN